MMAGLREAAAEDLPGLLERLHSFLPQSFTVHGVLKVQLRYDLGLDGRILVAPAPSSLVLITRICAGMETQSLTLFWDSEHEEDGAVAELLASTPHVDWTKPLFLFAVASHLLQKVEQMVRSGQLGEARLVAQPISLGHLYTITASRLPTTPRLPKEFRLGPIEEDHVEHLHKHWMYGSSVSLESYKRMLRTLPGVGVFTTTAAPATTTGDELHNNIKQTVSGAKTLEDTRAITVDGKMSIGNTVERTVTKDDVPRETLSTDGDEAGWPETNGLPVAWTNLALSNYISNTYTLKEYRRLGLGRAVTTALAARLLQEDDRASAFIVDDNEASIKLHEQLGFIRECAFGWRTYSLPKDSET